VADEPLRKHDPKPAQTSPDIVTGHRTITRLVITRKEKDLAANWVKACRLSTALQNCNVSYNK